MPQSQCLRIPLKPGQTETFVAWAERAQRENLADMHRILRAERMLSEVMCLERGPDGDAVILYTRAEDLAHAAEEMQKSTHPFDVETREVIARTWDVARAVPLSVLFEAVGPFE